MYIPNDDTQNCPFSRLKLVVKTFKTPYDPTNNNSLKSPKFLSKLITNEIANVKKTWGLV